jgi:hypothetical protein
MAKTINSANFTIKPDYLAQQLEITTGKLYEIVDFFDSDTKDEWDLKEEEHFIWLCKKQGTRIFSEQGAYEIALYLDKTEKKSLWKWCKEFLFHHQEKLRHAFVQQKVLNNSTSLIRRGDHHYLSRKDTVAILSTSYARLSQSFSDIQKSDPLIYDTEFIEIDKVNYYSLRAFEALSGNLGENLKQEHRRAWCKEVACTGSKTLQALISEQDKFQQKIAAAKSKAKTRDKSHCQITGLGSNRTKQIDMEVHHIYCSSHYPTAADNIDNLITLTQEVHREFHNWHGSNKKPCTIHDLIEFAATQHPEQDVGIKLYQLKLKLRHLDKSMSSQ